MREHGDSYETFMKDRATCARIYKLAAWSDPAYDKERWPDVLAFRAPVNDLKLLLTLMGIVDEDLRSAITNAGRSIDAARREDVDVFENTVRAALAEQRRR